MKKRALVTLLAFCLVAALCVVGAAASGPLPGSNVATAADFEAALEAGGEVTLTGNITISEKMDIVVTQPVTLNLNGNTVTKTYSETNHHFIVIENGGSLTINDTSGGKLEATGSYGYGIRVNSGGTLIVNGGTLEANQEVIYTGYGTNNARIEINGGTIRCTGYDSALQLSSPSGLEVNITGGEIISPSGNAIFASGNGDLDVNISGGTLTGGQWTVHASEGADVTINGDAKLTTTGNTGSIFMDGTTYHPSTLTIEGGTIEGDYVAVDVEGYSQVTMTGGSITTERSSAMELSENATAEISGGTLTTTASAAALNVTGSATAAISGGTFTGGGTDQTALSGSTEQVTVTGGTFSSSVGSYIPTGSALTQDDNGTIVPNPAVNAVASINDIGYDSLANAIAAANDGDTVKLLRSTTGNGTIELSDGRSITLDMNGFDIGFSMKQHINIRHGELNITGKGMLYEEKPEHMPVAMYGSQDPDAENYSVVTVGPDVTLKGWTGLYIWLEDNESAAYGVVANVYGTLISVRDTSGSNSGHALSIHGSITAADGNVPIITLDGATLFTEEGNGMFLAGYAETSIKDSTIISGGEGAGIEIRAGELSISGDTYVQAGEGEVVVRPADQGSTSINVALAVAQHTSKLPIEVTVEGGTFRGGAAVYETNPQGNDSSAIEKVEVNIEGGSFVSPENRTPVVSADKTGFVSGGNFSAPVNRDYLADNLNAELYSPGSAPTPFSYFTSVDDALAAAQPGDEITYIGDGTVQNYELKVDYGFGDVVTMNVPGGYEFALPELTRSGYTFNGWRSGGAFYRAGETLTVRGNTVLTAVWDLIEIPDTYEINVEAGANGEASTSLTNASAGSTVTVSVTPDEGYELDYITVDGERIDGTSFTMPGHDVTVRVYFKEIGAAMPFVDVAAGAWYYDAVNYVWSNGLMEGTSATTFEPDTGMTRAMVWAVLARMDGQSVSGVNWVTAARSWAMAEGVSDGTDPNSLITREQLATMLYRYAGSPAATGNGISAFTDAGSVSSWAVDAMNWALEQGIITGMGDGTLSPQGTATRAQAAAMLMRFVER